MGFLISTTGTIPLDDTAPAEETEELARLQRLNENPYIGENVSENGAAKQRVREWTAPRKRKFFALVAGGASITKAAKALGLTRQSAHYQRSIDSDFAEAWEEARERQADLTEDALAGLSLQTKNVGAVIFSLKNQRPEKWKDRHEVLSESTKTYNINISDQLSPGALQALHAIAQAEQDRAAAFIPPPEPSAGSAQTVAVIEEGAKRDA